MNFINEVFTQVLAHSLGYLFDQATAALGPNVVAKWNVVIARVAGWNELLPLATIFTIAFATFGTRMGIRVFRLAAGYIPTING